jgi:hypothetical protein
VRRRGGDRFAGRLLLRIWLVAAAVYVLVAGAMSVAPIKAALLRAHEPPPARPAQVAPTNGPIPDAPDSPAIALAKSLARQAAVVAGPPLLTLWFGWDFWFAVTGFLERRAHAGRGDGGGA